MLAFSRCFFFPVLLQDMDHKRAAAGIQMMIPEEADHTLQNLHWWFYPQSLQLISLKKKWPAKNVNVTLGYLWDGRICWLRLSEFLTHIFELGMKKSSRASMKECYMSWFVWEGAFPWPKTLWLMGSKCMCRQCKQWVLLGQLGSWILSALLPCGKLDQEIGILKWSIFHPTIIHPQAKMDTPDTPRSL